MLLQVKSEPVFDLDEISRGDIVYACKDTWDEGICGIVVDVNELQMRILYLPKIQNVMNHCIVKASQVAAGLWELRYSHDQLDSVEVIPAGEEAK